MGVGATTAAYTTAGAVGAPPDPNPNPEPPSPSDNFSSQGSVFELVSDTQFQVWPYSQGVIQSMTVQKQAPGRRLPGQNLGVGHTLEALMHQAVPLEARRNLKGTIFGGDAADVAAVEEMGQFRYWMERIARSDPRMALKLFEVGNHDVFNAGTGRTGFDGPIAMGVVLHLEGARSYGEDIHVPQVGEKKNILDKEETIRIAFQTAGWDGPHPVVLRQSNQWNYTLENGAQADWTHTRAVVPTFWRQEPNGTWNAVVRFHHKEIEPDKKPFAEKVWIYAGALKLDDLKTSHGTVPIYYIALDTEDFTDRRDEPELFRGLQNLQGQVSGTQVRLVDAFIAEAKRRNPNAVFVIGGHYAVTQTRGVRESGLYRTLSDPAVIAVVASHSHERDLFDLNGYKADGFGGRITRITPLLQYKVPSVIEAPNEMSLLRTGVNPDDSGQIFVELQYVGLDEGAIPGSSDEVREELAATIPDILTYDDSIEHIRHPQLREAATPGTSLPRFVEIAANLDDGVMGAPGRIHDEIVAKDTIPAHIEEVQAVFRILARTAKLLMAETDNAPMGVDFERAMIGTQEYPGRVAILDRRYEDILQERYERHAELDQTSKAFDREIYNMEDELHTTMDHERNPRRKGLLRLAHKIVTAMHSYVYAYENWLDNYEDTLKMNRPNATSELINEASLFGNRHFRTLLNAIQQIPYGSYAHAYLVHVLLESSRQAIEFYQDPTAPSAEVPDRVRVSFDVSSRGIDVWKSPLPNRKRPPWCGECREQGRRMATQARARVDAAVPPVTSKPVEGHWVGRFGAHMRGGTNFGESLRIGGQWHLYNPSLTSAVPVRVNLHAAAGVDLIEWQNLVKPTGKGFTPIFSADLPVQVGLTVGDPLGILEVGAEVAVGHTRRNINGPGPTEGDNFVDVHGLLTLGEGTFYVEINGHRFFRNKGTVPYTTVGIDVMRWLSHLNVTDRSF